MKISKFLLCENPLADQSDGRVFILHTRQPVILAECFHFELPDYSSEEEMEADILKCKLVFNTGSTLDYPPEYIVLGAIWIESGTEATQEPADGLAGITRHMAGWYKSYLIW